MNRRTIAVAAVIASAALTLTACKSSGGPSGSGNTKTTNTSPVAGSSGSSSGLSNAQAIVAASSTEPSDIPITTPLPKAPEKGIKVAFLTCQAAACSLLNPGFIAAANALGWKPKVITYDAKQPGQALQQAIDAGYKYIATTSISLSTVTPQIQAAKAKGVAIFGAYTGDTPQGKGNGLYGVAQNFQGSDNNGKLIAAWTIVNSNSNAHTLYVDLPLYPT